MDALSEPEDSSDSETSSEYSSTDSEDNERPNKIARLQDPAKSSDTSSEDEDDPEQEECFICREEYQAFAVSQVDWKELGCGHRLCLNCYDSIETSGTTMSGVHHTFVKCPFCQGITGTEIGDCPNGTMAVSIIKAKCSGYKVSSSIQIHYYVNSGYYHLNRVAYLPNNPEGNEILSLLRTAWDRRLCFVIGDSVTTGAQNVLVWNIHHKTSLNGGVGSYGYPDPGYFQRVKTELRGHGIE